MKRYIAMSATVGGRVVAWALSRPGSASIESRFGKHRSLAFALACLIVATGVIHTTKPASAYGEGSTSGVVELMAFDCARDGNSGVSILEPAIYPGMPIRPTDPPLPSVTLYGSCAAPVEVASGEADRSARTAQAPVVQGTTDAQDIAAGRAAADTDPVSWAGGVAAHLVEEVDTLAGLILEYAEATALSTTTASARIDVSTPAGPVRRKVDVTHCLTLACVSTLPSSLPQALGCLPPACAPLKVGTVLEVRTTDSWFQAAGNPHSGDTLDDYTFTLNRKGYHNRDDETGGPNVAYGIISYNLYKESRQFGSTWYFTAHSTQYSVTPVEERGCRLWKMKNTIEPLRSTEIAGWLPGGVDSYGTALTDSISAGVAFERGKAKGELSIGRSWNRPKGIAGGETTDRRGHRVLWQSGALKGDKYTKEAAGVATWKRPRSKTGGYTFYGDAWIKGCNPS